MCCMPQWAKHLTRLTLYKRYQFSTPVSILQMRKQRLREVIGLAQNHRIRNKDLGAPRRNEAPHLWCHYDPLGWR